MKKLQEPTVRKTQTVTISRIRWRPLIGLASAIVVMSIVVVSGRELKHVPPAAPSFTVLHSFGYFPDGGQPVAGLLRDTAGNLYGTTSGGGAHGAGVVFELIRCDSGYDFKVFHSFSGADGANPTAGLIGDAGGNLYGTTRLGGAHGAGVVFKLSPAGTETVLYSFTGGADGGNPQTVLVQGAAGNLYGTTIGGGAHGVGVVFKLSPSGTETVLYSFTGGADGGIPYAGLIQDAAGNLYGTTYAGGDPTGSTSQQPEGFGVVFKLSSTGIETVLYSFTGGTDGEFPIAGLIRDAGGNLYGTTTFGGAYGDGVVFKLSPSGIETVLHSFTGGGDGREPYAGLIQDAAGNFYGTTRIGGAPSGEAYGVVFKLAP